ncbi:hypothetical protein BWQ96_09658 [Gracilariopsis chorda]|uniref:Iminophenyl-pyruvate dimer synthase domain-containing protein n=1 Tax=Gracilariopsis chorda TaxID=448386 RepID=A0A2V3IEY2_9FLOR|nr:hypothetical protein BWQ96_09658 [Gracilariopsis chorda]|eukprot:PXF40627.1 hypothetical protein BWQ96_09658 [Gracilariopsis chorda]
MPLGCAPEDEIPRNPTWVGHILPMLKKHRADPRAAALMDYKGVIGRRHELMARCSHPPRADDRVFPPGLSKDFRAVFARFLSGRDGAGGQPLLFDINDPQQLKDTLQLAAEVELATLPPYLGAMYSIKDRHTGGNNGAIRSAISSVVYQEMAHFALVCNMLVSISGQPNFTDKDNIISYPTELPGGLHPGLCVRIRKASIEQMQVFMEIEKPLKTRVPKKDETTGIWYVDKTCDLVEEDNTIGYMYEQIKTSMETLFNNDSITFEHEHHQVEYMEHGLGIKKILSLDDAKEAINVILEQGEGGVPGASETGLDPVDDTTGDMAHYFMFSEVFYGRKIVRNDDPSTGFKYSGEAFELDPAGVYNMMDDPDYRCLTADSSEYKQAVKFAGKYHDMLVSLTSSFNGTPSDMSSAVTDMRALRALAPMAMKADNGLGTGETIGTPFQEPPANT